MATLSKKDLGALFVLLGLIYLFDGYASGYLVVGVIGFIIVAGLGWYSGQPGCGLLGEQGDGSVELLMRIGVICTLLGVLLGNFYVILLAFLIAEVTLFMPIKELDVDLWSLGIQPAWAPNSKKNECSVVRTLDTFWSGQYLSFLVYRKNNGRAAVFLHELVYVIFIENKRVVVALHYLPLVYLAKVAVVWPLRSAVSSVEYFQYNLICWLGHFYSSAFLSVGLASPISFLTS
jgi:hypothetical protein